MVWIPTIELIEIIYETQFGMKVRYSNKQYLETALDLVKWGFPFKNSEMAIWEKAAVLMRNIVQFHVFVDGCKRMGIHVAYIFLRKNGWVLEPEDKEEMFRFPMAVATGNLTLDEITDWFRTHSKKMNKKQGFNIHIELTIKHVQDTVKSLDALRLKPKKYAPLPLPEYRSDEFKNRLVRLYEH